MTRCVALETAGTGVTVNAICPGVVQTDLVDQLGEENIYQATSILSDSTIKAYQDAQGWLAERTS